MTVKTGPAGGRRQADGRDASYETDRWLFRAEGFRSSEQTIDHGGYLQSDAAVIEFVARTPGAIGYVKDGTRLDGVKALRLTE